MIIELLPEILLAERARVQVVCDNYSGDLNNELVRYSNG